jgi:hypothetical protein
LNEFATSWLGNSSSGRGGHQKVNNQKSKLVSPQAKEAQGYQDP